MYSYFGRSTGAGGLAIWTHSLKDISVLEWSDANYTGTALKMGAGVQGYDAVEAAGAAGLSMSLIFISYSAKHLTIY